MSFSRLQGQAIDRRFRHLPGRRILRAEAGPPRGSVFEHYDDPSLRTDEKGIHEIDGGRVAWLKDPDGNTFAIEEEET